MQQQHDADNRIDWSGFAHAKERPGSQKRGRRRAARRRAAKQTAVSAEVKQRQDGACYAYGFNPKCLGRCTDGHHLIRRSFHKENSAEIELGLCRACHNEVGKRLRFWWSGPRPNANIPGSVKVIWIQDYFKRRDYLPTATGNRRPDAVCGVPGQRGAWPEDKPGAATGVEQHAGTTRLDTAAGERQGVRVHQG